MHLPESSEQLTLANLRSRAQADLGAHDVVIEFSRDVVEKFLCPSCKTEETKFAALASIPFGEARCPKDGHLRTVNVLHRYAGENHLGSRRLSELGLPLFDAFIARHGEREIGYIPEGDASRVLGVLAGERANR